MCGRFTQLFTWEELYKLYNLTNPLTPNLKPSWNIAPTQDAGVVLPEGDGRIYRTDALGPRAPVGQRSQNRKSGDQRQNRDRGGKTPVPQRMEIPPLPHPGQRVLRVARNCGPRQE